MLPSSPGTGVRLTLWMHAIIVGLAQMTQASPLLTQLLMKGELLARLRLDFRAELEAALMTLFTGATVRTPKQRPASTKRST